MRFEAKDKQQIRDEKVLPAGEYAFQVSKAIDSVSKKGNDMIALTLAIQSADGKRFVNDYLLPTFPEKILGFCEATGMVDLYASGVFVASDCIGREGYVKLKIKDDPQFGIKNEVHFYVPEAVVQQTSKTSQVAEPLPF